MRSDVYTDSGLERRERFFHPRTGIARVSALVLAVLLLCVPGQPVHAKPDGDQLLVTKGTLPHSGRVVIRTGFGWLLEDDPLFTSVARVLREELQEHGLEVVSVSPSAPAAAQGN